MITNEISAGNLAVTDLMDLNRELCGAIREGRIGLETAGLAEHLTLTTRDKVGIDQPNYGGLKRLLAD